MTYTQNSIKLDMALILSAFIETDNASIYIG